MVSKEAIVKGQAVLEYIPQRPPIVMVDSFFGIEGDCSYAGLTITSDNILVNNDVFTESGLIEHMAQAASLQVGYVCKQNNVPVPVGFIGAIKGLVIHHRPKVGNVLYTCIKKEHDVFDITIINAKTWVGDELMAECEMKIFLSKE